MIKGLKIKMFDVDLNINTTKFRISECIRRIEECFIGIERHKLKLDFESSVISAVEKFGDEFKIEEAFSRETFSEFKEAIEDFMFEIASLKRDLLEHRYYLKYLYKRRKKLSKLIHKIKDSTGSHFYFSKDLDGTCSIFVDEPESVGGEWFSSVTDLNNQGIEDGLIRKKFDQMGVTDGKCGKFNVEPVESKTDDSRVLSNYRGLYTINRCDGLYYVKNENTGKVLIPERESECSLGRVKLKRKGHQSSVHVRIEDLVREYFC